MKIFRKVLIVVTAAWMVGLIGCSTPPKPFEYESQRELKPGPGLFTGEDGYFTIYQQQVPKEAEPPKDSKTKEESNSEEDTE